MLRPPHSGLLPEQRPLYQSTEVKDIKFIFPCVHVVLNVTHVLYNVAAEEECVPRVASDLLAASFATKVGPTLPPGPRGVSRELRDVRLATL